MQLIHLVLPNGCSLDEIEEFKNEFLAKSEEIPGGAGLFGHDDVSEWVLKTEKDLSLDITSRVYFARRFSDNRIVGVINLRYPYEGYVTKYGHIGYAVRPSERMQGLGSEMLNQCLVIAKDYRINQVLITCDIDNMGSQGIIKRCGGVLESNQIQDKSATLRFWISTR